MNEPIDATLNYIGGLFDGEGSCGVYPIKGGKAKHWIVSCTISMTSRLGIDCVAECFGGNVHLYRHDDNPLHQPTFHWGLTSTHAIGFLRTIHPYLRVKYEQVTLTLTTAELLDRDVSRGSKAIIADYREKLLSAYPGGSRVVGHRGPDRSPRTRVGYFARYRGHFEGPNKGGSQNRLFPDM